MAYVTGTATSINDLLSAIQNACTANGWTLSGSVLHKDGCYVDIHINGSLISIKGGTGIDGSDNMTGVCDTHYGQFCIDSPRSGWFDRVNFSYPAEYFIHINKNPDEVYVIVKWEIEYYQMLAFGQSAMPGLNGSGNWYLGTRNQRYYGITDSGEDFGSRSTGFSLFCRGTHRDIESFGVDHGLDGQSKQWKVEGSWRDWRSLALRQPNRWNSESILQPVRVYVNRPSGFVSPVLECANARFISVKNFDPEQVFSIGTDKWKVYPWIRKGPGGTYSNSSGYFGHAIRYDGP